MSTTPNFETSYSCPTLLEAYFSEHSINVTIIPIGCQMAEISVKNGPIVIKKSYGFDFGGDFCSYVHKNDYVTDLPSFFNYPLMIGSTLFTVNYRGSLEKLHTVDRRRSFTAIDLYRIYELFGLLESCR